MLSPHGRIRKDDTESWLDDLTGGGFVILTTTETTLNHLSSESKHIIKRLNVKTIHLTNMDDNVSGYEDVDGRFLAFMRTHNVSVLLIRPDYYIYGGDKAGDANRLLVSLAKSLFLVKENV